MNRKKTLLNTFMVALAAAISFGFISCDNKDKKEPIVDDGRLSSRELIGQWHNKFDGYYIEFRKDSTYLFDSPDIRAEGNYTITESQKSERFAFDATLFKMNVSGNSGFNQFWVYCYKTSIGIIQISFDIYFNNELVVENKFGYLRYY